MILAIDQGTSSTKTFIFDTNGKAVCKASEALQTYYPEGSMVEQKPEEIYHNVLSSVKQCLSSFQAKGGNLSEIKTCGISNQRETFVLWNKEGTPLYNAIVWQCKRSIDICKRLTKQELSTKINEKTGLIIDPYFSGTKVIWLYENLAHIKESIDRGEAYFGNIDTWLLYKLTNGKSYFTDYTNASRTLFFNLETLAWDRELLDIFGLSNLNLPTVKPSSSMFGSTNLEGLLDHNIDINALIGDSQSAAFGETCFDKGSVKATLGTGCSILMNIGSEPKTSHNGMITTVCWSTKDRVDYALEGIIVSAGSTIEWVRNQLNLFNNTNELEQICTSLKDNGGVYVIPAFSGLGAPHWKMNRKASIEGLSFDSNKKHIIRAAVESVPYQIKDVIEAMEKDAGTPLSELKIDGGMTNNKFVTQFLADLLDRKVTTIKIADVSALGAAYLAGLKCGIYKSLEQLKSFNKNTGSTFSGPNSKYVKTAYSSWQSIISNIKY